MRLSLAIRLDLSHCYAWRNAVAISRVSLLIVDILKKWVFMHNTTAVITGGIHVDCVVPPATQLTGPGSAAPPTRNALPVSPRRRNNALLATFSYPKKLQKHRNSDAISLWGETQWQLHMRKICLPCHTTNRRVASQADLEYGVVSHHCTHTGSLCHSSQRAEIMRKPKSARKTSAVMHFVIAGIGSAALSEPAVSSGCRAWIGWVILSIRPVWPRGDCQRGGEFMPAMDDNESPSPYDLHHDARSYCYS
ncbi:hypothetical protein BKA56DRAFT_624215 [Ilyonectria sp. MPI-CAGE-AT-0026]|nr:hypothetical protein BKA56DRAFT_624215 [Ilyonectria sp. MPI-CAGE-AT-0026]